MWEKEGLSKTGGKTWWDFSFGEPVEDTPIDLVVTKILTISRKKRWDEPVGYNIVRPDTRLSFEGQSSSER